jgi:hypothetical protein
MGVIRTLQPHPDTRASTVDSISVAIDFLPDGKLQLVYRLHGKIDALRLPSVAARSRADGLWRHTCCEAFINMPDSKAYREFRQTRLPSPRHLRSGTGLDMKFGLDRLLSEPELRRPLAGRRVALLAHPASVTADLTHALDALAALPEIKLSAAFGPQHGLRGDKQDNMMESPDYLDPQLGIPVFSLYGEVRRPTPR